MTNKRDLFRLLFRASFFICCLAVISVRSNAQSPAAKQLRFEFIANKRRVDVERTQTQSKNLSEEKWVYDVSIRNISFANQTDLTIEYHCYKRDDKYGAEKSASKLPLKAIPGKETIASFANSAIHKFTTQEILISKDELKAGWYYTNSSKEKIKDSLYGIWIRVIKDNEIVAEYVNPPALKTKTDW